MIATDTHTARFMCHTAPLPVSLTVSEISIRMKLQADGGADWHSELESRADATQYIASRLRCTLQWLQAWSERPAAGTPTVNLNLT